MKSILFNDTYACNRFTSKQTNILYNIKFDSNFEKVNFRELKIPHIYSLNIYNWISFNNFIVKYLFLFVFKEK